MSAKRPEVTFTESELMTIKSFLDRGHTIDSISKMFGVAKSRYNPILKELERRKKEEQIRNALASKR